MLDIGYSAKRPTRLSYKEQRDRQDLPHLIEHLEKEIAELHAKLCGAALYQKEPSAIDAAKKRLPLAEAELETAFTRWVEIEERAKM